MRHVLILTALLCPAPAEAAAAFRQFDFPGAASTCGTSVASNGLVAGVGAGRPWQAAPSLLPYTPVFWKSGSLTAPAPGRPGWSTRRV